MATTLSTVLICFTGDVISLSLRYSSDLHPLIPPLCIPLSPLSSFGKKRPRWFSHESLMKTGLQERHCWSLPQLSLSLTSPPVLLLSS